MQGKIPCAPLAAEIPTQSNTYINKNLKKLKWVFPGRSVVKTLPSNAGHVGLIPGQGAKSLHASCTKHQNVKQKPCCNKDFKNGPHQ